MTGKLVNLSRARKARERSEKARIATANAARHGRTRAEKQAEAAERERAEKGLDAHQRDPE
jgi:hypothetical protein